MADNTMHFCPNCHMPLMPNLECDECGHQFRVSLSGVVEYAELIASPAAQSDELAHLRAENARLREIVSELAEFHNAKLEMNLYQKHKSWSVCEVIKKRAIDDLCKRAYKALGGDDGDT